MHHKFSTMAIGSFLCTLVAAVFLCLCAPVWGQENAPLASPALASESDAGRLAEAEALVKNGRFNEALVLLRPLAERGTIDTQALFLIGLALERRRAAARRH